MKPVMVGLFRRHLKRSHQGSAALITTIAISAILVVLFVGITTIATREIRQSINADNASRALYAAEAGVEDASRQISNDPSYRQDTCNAGGENPGKEVPVSTEGGSQAAWTCRTVTLASNQLEGRIDKDEVVQVDLSKAKDASGAAVNVQYMSIEWNNPQADSSTPIGVSGSVVLPYTSLPHYLSSDTSQNGWGGRAAALELTTTWYKKGATFAPADLAATAGVFPVRTALATPCSGVSICTTQDLSPLNGGSGTGCVTTNANDQSCVPTADQNVTGLAIPAAFQAQTQLSIGCQSAASAKYSCRLPAASGAPAPATTYNISNLTSTEFSNGGSFTTSNCTSAASCNTLLRVKSRYSAASYSMRFYYDADASVAGVNLQPAVLSDGYATIDVTARSGNYFRRVQAKKQIQPTVFTGVFDSTLFSGKNICKDLTVYKDLNGAPEKKPDGSAEPNKGRNSCDV